MTLKMMPEKRTKTKYASLVAFVGATAFASITAAQAVMEAYSHKKMVTQQQKAELEKMRTEVTSRSASVPNPKGDPATLTIRRELAYRSILLEECDKVTFDGYTISCKDEYCNNWDRARCQVDCNDDSDCLEWGYKERWQLTPFNVLDSTIEKMVSMDKKSHSVALLYRNTSYESHILNLRNENTFTSLVDVITKYH